MPVAPANFKKFKSSLNSTTHCGTATGSVELRDSYFEVSKCFILIVIVLFTSSNSLCHSDLGTPRPVGGVCIVVCPCISSARCSAS